MTIDQFLHPTPRDEILKRRYGSARWRRLSTSIRQRDGRCMVGVSKKCTGRAEVADHIVRPEEGGELYDPANLRASCRSCNFQRHNAAYFREKADAQHGSPSALEAVGSPPPRQRSAAYTFAYHRHQWGPKAWQVQGVGYMRRGMPTLDGCPPDCSLPKRGS